MLCFHDIGRRGRYAIATDDFIEILDMLRPYRVISLADWIDARYVQDIRPPVVLTFDDGYPSHRNLVLPELRRRGYGATFYIYAEQLRHSIAWRQVSANLEAAFEIGSHSWSHAALPGETPNAVYKELYLAHNFLEESLQRSIRSFAWPYGDYSATGIQMAFNAGFQNQVSVDYRVATPQDIKTIIPRYTVMGKAPKQQLAEILAKYLMKTRVR